MATYGIFQMCLNLSRKILAVIPKLFELLSGFSGGLASQLISLLIVWLIVKFGVKAIEKILIAGEWLMRKFE